MQRKIFWLLFLTLDSAAGLLLPLLWGLVLTLPILIASWWIVYRSGWFE